MRVRSEVPVGVSAFVGRDPERAQVAGLVTDGRVVTLIGSGGCGKTRLAMEIAGDVGSRFADGACWVELQSVLDPAAVATAVGWAAGVRERPGEPLVDTLAEQLRERHLLILLDNCEHLVTACAELVRELTSACPRLHVLATSREPLAVEGETTFGVAPLGVPDPGARSARTVAATDAGRLFEVRARQVRPDFTLTDDDAAAVATICRRLDGVPLAIELAAARVRVLAPAQIATGLADRFRLLAGGGRGAPSRQRSLEGSVAWSFGLLADPERLALARLSVFAGPFDLEAAEAVVGGPDIAEVDVLDLVAGLADRSLLQVGEHHGRARYRLLETVRLFASEKLADLDDPSRVRDRHLAFYIGLARRAQAGLNDRQPEPWMARLAADLEDLRAAMDRAAGSGDLRALVDLTEPIDRFWLERGQSAEMRRRLQAAADTAQAGDDERVRSLTTAAYLAAGSGEFGSAHDAADRAVDAARAADVGGPLAAALGMRAWMGAESGRSTSEQVDADVDEAVQLAGQCGEATTHAFALMSSGAAVGCSRSIDGANRFYDRAVEVCETAGLTIGLPSALTARGLWSVWAGELDVAVGHARRGIELSRQIGRPGWEVQGQITLGAVAVLQGDHDQAGERLAAAQDLLRSHALEGGMFDVWLQPWLALSAYVFGELTGARVAAETMARRGRERHNRRDEATGEWLLGMLAQVEERHVDARTHLEASRALSTDPNLPLPLGRSLLGLAQLAEHDGDLDDAWELAHDALEGLDDRGDRVGTTAALETIAALAVERDEPERSLRLLAASERFHASRGIVRFPLEAERFTHGRDAARAAANDAEATACWDAGSLLSLPDAVAYTRRGRGERRRPPVGWASLTPTEEEVVRLVAQGHTNAEVGERLFVSLATVKKHLSHVYTKLDLHSRAELVAQATRRNL
jgi:predicted ATPase/DNA-binding CsgD family transcriptional regulator